MSKKKIIGVGAGALWERGLLKPHPPPPSPIKKNKPKQNMENE